ncbi:MAG TPA: HNH endonuclease, partial [Nonomuraea sp.]|nr:HNH endonuclease [Nonomuraea sp.]
SKGAISLHRLLCNAQPGQQVDHRNGDGLDNRRSNLRLCTRSQNIGNARTPRTNTSGYKGVYFERARGLWCAEIWFNMRKRRLGRFADPKDAARAYNAAALEQWGEFARINEIPGDAA